MGLSVQPTNSPNITSVNGVPTKAAYYQQIASAPSSTPNSAFYNNPYGISSQEIDGMQRANPYSAPSSNNGTGTSGGDSVAPAVNPYTTAFLASLPGQLAGIHAGASAASSSANTGLGSSINDLVAQLKIDQSGIDEKGIQNELARSQGTAGVLSMIQHGLQSGGITLANKNASNSSAAEALARAYGDIGRRAQSQVGTQYAEGQHAVDVAQTNFNTNRSAKMGDIQAQKTQAINSIVADAQNKLSYLESQAASASLPGKVDIQGQMQSVRNEATAALAGIDQQLSQGVGSVNPMANDAERAKAASLANAGTAAAAPFAYSAATPAQFQNTGPFASQLPIFTLPSSKKQGA